MYEKLKYTHRASQKWNGLLSLLWLCGPSCEVSPSGIVLTHCNRFATAPRSALCHRSGCPQTLCVLHTNKTDQRYAAHDSRELDYFGILERFMSPGKGGLDGLGCRFNVTDPVI